jgi:PAS domain S-box-containing protein
MLAKILIIDDQPQELAGLLAWLQREEYEISLVRNNSGLTRMLELSVPDLIMLSATIPGVGLEEFCQHVRNHHQVTLRKAPIIILAPEGNSGFVDVDALEAGATDIIRRPINARLAQRRIKGILEAQEIGLGDTRHVLEETCQSATAILGCDLAWLLITEGMLLHSRVMISERGQAAAEVFLRMLTDNSPEHPSYPLIPENNLIADAALGDHPLINVTLSQVKAMPNGERLHRAMTQLRLNFIHFLPLETEGRVIGLLVAAGKGEYHMDGGRGARLVTSLARQCVAVIDNTRMMAGMAARERQMETEQVFRRMILDTMGEGLVVVDERATIRYVNTRLLRMTGYERHELYGKGVDEIFHLESRRGLLDNLFTLSASASSHQLLTRVGQVVPVMVSRATMPENKQNFKVVLVISDVTEQVKRTQAVELQSARLRTLNAAMQRITSALSQEDVIAAVLQAAFDTVRCVNACLYMFDGQEVETIRVVSARGVHEETLRTVVLRAGQGIAGRVIQRQKTEYVAYLSPDVFEPPVIEPQGSSVIAVPLLVLDTVVGVLEVINKADGRFTDDDCEFLENLGAAAAIAMENAHLFSQAQRQVNELSMMLDASSAVSSTLDISGILELITRRLTEAMNASRCSISMWLKEAGQLIVLAEACNAFWERGEGPVRISVDIPVIAAVLQRELPLIAAASDTRLDPRLRDYLDSLGMAHAIFVPLVLDGTVVGLVELFNPRAEQRFKTPQVHAVRDSIAQWRAKLGSDEVWYSFEHMTALVSAVQLAGKAHWCAISMWNRSQKQLIVLRETGFAVWDETHAPVLRLDGHPTMANSLNQGMPITLLPALLFNDPEESALMKHTGSHTGLVTPLVVRGEASGLVKLLDVTKDRSFDAAEISLCQAIANVVANALENARLFHALEKRAETLQAAYDDMRRQDKVKDDLIQNLSHELKTPLMQAMYEVMLLGEGEMGPVNEDQRNSLQAILTRIETLSARVTNMVIMDATQEMQFTSVNMADVINRVLETTRSKAERAEIEIASQCSDPCFVRANESRLVEVLDQLLDNAIKFSPNADRVEVRVENGSGYMVKVSVRDYGIGISKSEFENIFQRGYQVDGSATRRFGGTGLGLSVAKQVVEAHGGKIWVESTPGQGSQFFFTVPKWLDADAYPTSPAL